MATIYNNKQLHWTQFVNLLALSIMINICVRDDSLTSSLHSLDNVAVTRESVNTDRLRQLRPSLKRAFSL